MKIQYVSKYLSLSKEGLVPRIDCPVDQGSLLCNTDNEDKIFLYCLSCNYKKYIGLQFYDNMKGLVDNAIR